MSGCHPLTRTVLEVVQEVPLEEVPLEEVPLEEVPLEEVPLGEVTREEATRGEAALSSQAREADRDRYRHVWERKGKQVEIVKLWIR